MRQLLRQIYSAFQGTGDKFRGPRDKLAILFIIDGILLNAAIILSSGVSLSGYIVLLGGSDFQVSLLNSSATWASIVALFSFVIFERLVRRKRLLLVLLAVSRLLICSVIFLPLLFGKSPAVLPMLTVMVIIGNIFWGIYSVGHTVWMMASFNKEVRTNFFYKRMFWVRITCTLVTVAMGFVLDWSGKSYAGFLVVFLTSLVFSAINFVFLLRTPESENVVQPDSRFNLTAFFEPFTHKAYRSYLLFIFVFYLCMQISSSFSSLYLIRYLQFDYKFISGVTVINYFFMITGIRPWRKLESRLGLKAVYRLSGLFITLEFLIYAFLTRDTYYILYFAPIFSGIGNSGFNIFTFTYRYELMPECNRTVYEGWFGAVFGVSVLLGPIIGTLIRNQLPVIQSPLFQNSGFQLMYLISFVLAASSLALAMREAKA